MLEDKDDDWPPAARHLADRPLAAQPLAARSLAVRPHGVDEAEPGTKALKGAARVRVRPTPDAPDPTRGANDRTGNGHAASAEHGSACSAPPRAPQHPERSVTAQWPRHPRSKHYTKRNDKSATNGMMRGAVETALRERVTAATIRVRGGGARDPESRPGSLRAARDLAPTRRDVVRGDQGESRDSSHVRRRTN